MVLEDRYYSAWPLLFPYYICLNSLPRHNDNLTYGLYSYLVHITSNPAHVNIDDHAEGS